MNNLFLPPRLPSAISPPPIHPHPHPYSSSTTAPPVLALIHPHRLAFLDRFPQYDPWLHLSCSLRRSLGGRLRSPSSSSSPSSALPEPPAGPNAQWVRAWLYKLLPVSTAVAIVSSALWSVRTTIVSKVVAMVAKVDMQLGDLVVRRLPSNNNRNKQQDQDQGQGQEQTENNIAHKADRGGKPVQVAVSGNPVPVEEKSKGFEIQLLDMRILDPKKRESLLIPRISVKATRNDQKQLTLFQEQQIKLNQKFKSKKKSCPSGNYVEDDHNGNLDQIILPPKYLVDVAIDAPHATIDFDDYAFTKSNWRAIAEKANKGKNKEKKVHDKSRKQSKSPPEKKQELFAVNSITVAGPSLLTLYSEPLKANIIDDVEFPQLELHPQNLTEVASFVQQLAGTALTTFRSKQMSSDMRKFARDYCSQVFEQTTGDHRRRASVEMKKWSGDLQKVGSWWSFITRLGGLWPGTQSNISNKNNHTTVQQPLSSTAPIEVKGEVLD